jgi:hypothetical protein
LTGRPLKQKTPAIARVLQGSTKAKTLLDLAFLIHDMLARHGIVLLHFQLVWSGTLVLVSGIEVTCTG